jgi:hypothetical protein
MGKKSKGFHELLRLQKISPELPVAKRKAQAIKVISPQETELSSSSNFEEQEDRIGLIVGVDKD